MTDRRPRPAPPALPRHRSLAAPPEPQPPVAAPPPPPNDSLAGHRGHAGGRPATLVEFTSPASSDAGFGDTEDIFSPPPPPPMMPAPAVANSRFFHRPGFVAPPSLPLSRTSPSPPPSRFDMSLGAAAEGSSSSSESDDKGAKIRLLRSASTSPSPQPEEPPPRPGLHAFLEQQRQQQQQQRQRRTSPSPPPVPVSQHLSEPAFSIRSRINEFPLPQSSYDKSSHHDAPHSPPSASASAADGDGRSTHRSTAKSSVPSSNVAFTASSMEKSHSPASTGTADVFSPPAFHTQGDEDILRSVEDSTILPPADAAPRHVRLRSQVIRQSQLQQQNQQQHPPGTPHSRSGGRRSTTPLALREAENYEPSYQINPKPHEPVWAKTWVRKGFVSMGAAWVVALKQRVKKFWEEARNLWNLIPLVRASSSRPLPWCSSLQSLLWLSFCRHKPFSRYPLLPPPPSPPPGSPCPWSIPCKRSTDTVYTLAHSGAYECRGIPGTSASSRFMFKCVNGNWTLHEDCHSLRSRDSRGADLAYSNDGGYGGAGMVCSCVASCHLPTASCAFSGSVCHHPDTYDEAGMASVFTQPDPAPLDGGYF